MARYQLNDVDELSVDVDGEIDLPGNNMQLQEVVINPRTNAVHAIEERQATQDGDGDVDGTISIHSNKTDYRVSPVVDGREIGTSEYLLKPFNDTERLIKIVDQTKVRIKRWQEVMNDAP